MLFRLCGIPCTVMLIYISRSNCGDARLTRTQLLPLYFVLITVVIIDIHNCFVEKSVYLVKDPQVQC